MAGEAYQVDYIINLRDNATAGITKFSQAASRLTKAAENLSAFQKQFNQISASFNEQLKLSVDTQRAHKSLDKILSKIRTIKKEAESVNLGVSGSVSGSSQKTRTVAAPSSRQTVSNNQSGLRPIVAPRGNKPLIPRNLEYQVLGPTRLGNVAMFDMFKGMGIAYGISAIGSGVRDIISQSTEYQNVMQTAKNILKANYKGGNFDKNFIDVERIAREVGVETKFTATEVADAVKFLAMAGLDMEAIKKSVRPIADIALIGDNDLGTTADVMTNIMTAYGIKPDEMRKTADVMTRTFTMSNTTLMELAESFKMAGSVLKLKNVPFETAAAAFGVLGDAGIKGTMAGTTMRTLMNNIVNPTKNQLKYWDILGVRRFDEYGNLRDINQIFGELNKLNVSDERSKEAQKRYEELQKKYKLDELQEGSDEYNKALAAYDKESEAIRRQYGGVDVFRLFRLTAASGGGVLMNGVEKWNKMIEENFMSEGLSNELAEKKKGTIAGMWAQLTSAFQEGGLKVFEENDSKFRGYLQKGIGWFKSDQFTHVLRGVIDLVADLGKTLIKFTKMIVELYEKFEPLIKRFLKFQLYLKGFQTILVSFKQFGNALLYPMSSVIGGLPLVSGMTAGPFSSRIFPRFNSFSGYYQSNVMNPSATGRGRVPLDYYSNLANMVGYDMRNINNYRATAGLNANSRRDLARYIRRTNMASAFQRNAGWAGMGGMFAGGTLGSAIAPNSEYAGTIGGALGSIGAIALSSLSIPGAGWIAAAAMVAAMGTAHIIKATKEMRKAKEAAESYYESMKKLNVESWEIGDGNDYFVAMLSLRTNSLVSEQERLKGSITLWKKYYAAMNGEDEEFDPEKEGSIIDNSKRTKELYEGLTGKRSGKFRRTLDKEMMAGGQIHDAIVNFKEMFPDMFENASVDELNQAFHSKSGLLLTASALDKENGLFSGPSSPVNKWLASAYKGLGTPEDIDSSIRDFANKFLKPAGSFKTVSEIANTDVESLENMSLSELLQYPTYYSIVAPRMKNAIESFVNTAQKMLSSDENEAMRAVQGFYMDDIFPYLGGGYDNFLSPDFAKAFKDKSNIPGKNLADKVKAQQIAFKQIVSYFENENISDAQKRYLLPMLNRTYWENTLGVDLSGIDGGFNANSNYEGYKWNEQLGVYTNNEGLWSIPGVKTFSPVNGMNYNSTWTMPSFRDMFRWNDESKKWEYGSWHAPMVLPESGSIAPPYLNWSYNGTGLQNDALALSSTKSSVSPNVTNNNNNNFSFTINVDTVKTDMDVDQVADFVTERVVDSLGMVSGQRYVPGFYNR